MSDSLMLEITGEDRERLVAALELCSDVSVTGVAQGANRLVLDAEYDGKMRLRLPPALFADIILEWLARTPGVLSAAIAPTWPKKPDIDGDCKKGWRLVADQDRIEIHPHWMIYHK